jgi:hypothetical protein
MRPFSSLHAREASLRDTCLKQSHEALASHCGGRRRHRCVVDSEWQYSSVVHALQLATSLGSNTQKRPSSSRQASLRRPRQAQLGGSGQVVGIGRHAVVVVDGGEEPGLTEQYWVAPHAHRSAMSKGR